MWNLLRCLFVCRVSTHNERDASPLGYAAGFGYRANREGSAWKAVGGLQQREVVLCVCGTQSGYRKAASSIDVTPVPIRIVCDRRAFALLRLQHFSCLFGALARSPSNDAPWCLYNPRFLVDTFLASGALPSHHRAAQLASNAPSVTLDAILHQ